jgi:hypothetical protein
VALERELAEAKSLLVAREDEVKTLRTGQFLLGC